MSTDLSTAEQAVYRYLYMTAQHQNTHAGWPGETSPDDHCDACHGHARAVVAAVRPRIWREVARWVRDTCEAYDDDRVCEDCTAQADLIVWHATDIESGRQTEGSGA